MPKPWQEKPLSERVWLGPFTKAYLAVGHLVGHLGCGGFSFWDRAKLLPIYDKMRFENCLRDLTVYEKRERGEYELTAHAKKQLWIIIGPPPDHPEYVKWWRGRMISVRQMRDEGTDPEFAAGPPVPLPDDPEPPAEPKKLTRGAKSAGKPRAKKGGAA
jgi:hypothetical protein